MKAYNGELESDDYCVVDLFGNKKRYIVKILNKPDLEKDYYCCVVVIDPNETGHHSYVGHSEFGVVVNNGKDRVIARFRNVVDINKQFAEYLI